MPSHPDVTDSARRKSLRQRLRRTGVAIDIGGRVVREIAEELRRPNCDTTRREGMLRFVSGALREMRAAVDELIPDSAPVVAEPPTIIARIDSTLPKRFEILTRRTPSRGSAAIRLPHEPFVEFLRDLQTSKQPPHELAAMRAMIDPAVLHETIRLFRPQQIMCVSLGRQGVLSFGDAELLEELVDARNGASTPSIAQLQRPFLARNTCWLGRWQFPAQCHLLPAELLSSLQNLREVSAGRLRQAA